ncbi:MAG: hypothetical protein K8R46_01770, partial [Pirellulales bacterium]|nr:hypothetical protein [Pirellulales bacterium]
QSDAGEEAIGIVTFLFKALMRLVPVAFGAGVICGTLLLGFACYLPFSGEGGLSVVQPTWNMAAYSLILSALLPLAAYLLFLLYYLLHDLCRAILALPSKLDIPAGKDADEIDANVKNRDN